MSELLGKDRKEVLKDLIVSLHEGADPKGVKEEFREMLRDASPVEIARAEQELIREGMPREEIHRLCEVHLAVFKESLEGQKPLAPEGVVKVRGELWKAAAANGEIETGKRVEVVGLEGLKLLVKEKGSAKESEILLQ